MGWGGWDWAAMAATGGAYNPATKWGASKITNHDINLEKDIPEGVDYLSGKKGYDTAAGGARNAEGRYRDLANQQWDRSQAGLDQAQGYFNPYDSYLGQMGRQGPGRMGANAYGQMQRDLGGPGATESAYAGMNFGPARSGGFYNDTRNAFGGASNAEALYAQDQGGLGAPGMHEVFAQQALEGNNPYLDRVEKQGLAQLNQQMAKRGHFNSGGAMTAIGNYSGEMAGQKFKYMGDLTASGQQAANQRLMGRGQLAGAADQGKLNRFGAMGSAANMADMADFNNRGQRMDFARANDQAVSNRNTTLFNAGMGMDAAGNQWRQNMADNYYRGAAGRSGLTMGATGMGLDAYGRGMDSSINAGFNATQLKGAGQAATGRFLADTGGRIAGAYMGNPGAAAGGGGGGGFQFAPGGGGGGGGGYGGGGYRNNNGYGGGWGPPPWAQGPNYNPDYVLPPSY